MVKKFVQVNENVLKTFRVMVKSNPTAAAIILFLIEGMGKHDNVLSCSFNVLEKETGFKKRALIDAVKYLESIRWIKVYKSGKSNVYAINAEVAWKAHQDMNYRAKFRATIILDSEEQNHDVTKVTKLTDLTPLQELFGLR